MRNALLILTIYFFLSCSNKQKRINNELISVNSTEINYLKQETNSLDGIWGMNNYFENILKDKTITKHKSKQATWFAILFEIKKDSLKSFGSIINENKWIDLKNDTLCVFDSFNGKYFLTLKDNNLILKQFQNQETNDSNVYLFRKRNDLKMLVNHKDSIDNIFLGKKQKSENIGISLTRYFNEKLISGTYINLKNNKEVIFEKNGELKKFKGFNEYEVRNYFGTSHPHKNLDVITLKNSKENNYKQFNWKFENEKLILTEFVEETTIYNGKKVVTDNYVMGKKRIEMILKNY